MTRAAAALVATGAGLALAPAAMAAPSATLTVDHPGFQTVSTASTFTAETIKLANTSSDGETITSVTIDLADGPTLFPDLVFDPDGTAGDTVGKALTLDTTTGTIVLALDAVTYAKPSEGGFGAVSVAFAEGADDFEAGATAAFSADIDPTSIKGSVGSLPAGPVSGAELHGATVSVSFSDGTTLTNDLSLVPGSLTDAIAVLAGAPAAAPTVVRAGGAGAPAATAKAEQQFVISGPPGSAGVLVIGEGHVDVTDAPGGGTDLEPFEANTVAGFQEIPFVIGTDGTVIVTVTLTDTPGVLPLTPTVTGLNSVTAYLTSGGVAGQVSDPLVVQLDGDVETTPPTITNVSPIDAQDDVPVTGNVQITFSEPMDVGTLAFDGAVTLTKGAGATLEQVATAITANEDGTVFTIDPVSDLAFDTSYTVTVTTGVTDVAGNALGNELSWVFTTAEQPVTPPPPPPPPAPPAAPTNTGPAICVTVPERPTNQARGTIRLEASQLLISQRIAQAAVRRANAVERWLEAGIVAGDLCGNAFGQPDFTGLTYVGGGVTAPVGPTPRALQVASASGGGGGSVALSAAQLLINQRISQAAVRRVNALTVRLDGGLTGGDLVDGAIGRGKLLNGLVIKAATAATPVAKSQTVLGEREGGGGNVTVSVAQLQINQRISQAAVRRVNALVDRLARGLTGADFKDGTLTVADLAAEARPQ